MSSECCQAAVVRLLPEVSTASVEFTASFEVEAARIVLFTEGSNAHSVTAKILRDDAIVAEYTCALPHSHQNYDFAALKGVKITAGERLECSGTPEGICCYVRLEGNSAACIVAPPIRRFPTDAVDADAVTADV